MKREWVLVVALAAGLAACGGENKKAGESGAAAAAQNRYPQGAPLGTKQVYDPNSGLGIAPRSTGVTSTGAATGSDHSAPASAQTGGSGTTR